jgi:hypothetical protein
LSAKVKSQRETPPAERRPSDSTSKTNHTSFGFEV